MINTLSFDAVSAATFGPHFRRPLPDSYSFAGLPALVRHVLTGNGPLGLPEDVLGDLPRRYDRVALILLDAFGWGYVERFMDRSPLLQQIGQYGVVSRLTSQFPSTTTAHVSTLTYGQPVGQHGMYEWFLYEPLLDRLIVPLTYSYAEDETPNTLPLSPEQLAPGATYFSQLAAEGVRSVVALNRSIFGVRSSQYAFAGVTPVPMTSLTHGLETMADIFNASGGPMYGYLHHGEIDYVAHKQGPFSPLVLSEAELALQLVEQKFLRRLKRTGDGRTLVLIVADHGQMTVTPERTLYVNELIPALEGLMKRGADGRVLVPAGSSRDMFLHVRPGSVEEVVGLLQSHPEIGGRAEVYTTRELAEAGLFGATSEAFWRRVGDVVVLPYDGQMIWWRDPAIPKQTQGFHGHHGGLSAQEMDIPLLALAL